MSLVKSLMFLLLVLTTSCGAGPDELDDLTVSEVWSKLSPSVFKLQSSTGSCSSFHIGNGYFLSANHCYDSVLSLKDDNNHSHDVDVIGRDEASDLLLLKANVPFLLHKVTISREEADVGERVVSIGFPGYMPEKTFMVGHVLGYKDNFLMTDGNSYWGMSGGLLADEEGNVVGVTSAIKLGGRPPEEDSWKHKHADISYFSRIHAINNLLTTANVALE